MQVTGLAPGAQRSAGQRSGGGNDGESPAQLQPRAQPPWRLLLQRCAHVPWLLAHDTGAGAAAGAAVGAAVTGRLGEMTLSVTAM